MQPKEVRSYVFLIKPKDPSIKLNKYETVNLGQLELRWLNYFGDPGVMKVGPFTSKLDMQRTQFEFDLEVISED